LIRFPLDCPKSLTAASPLFCGKAFANGFATEDPTHPGNNWFGSANNEPVLHGSAWFE
jgi:hypothetical protein